MGMGPRNVPGRPATPGSIIGLTRPQQIALNIIGKPIVAAGVLGGAALLANVPIKDRYADQFQEVLTFPKDINKQHFMSFRFVKYVKRNINDRKTIQDKRFITLPIPNNLVDSFSVSYDNTQLGPMLGGFGEALTGGSASGAFNALTDGAAAGAITALSNYVSPNLLPAASALSGVAINPFLTVVFKNPQFKTHNFTWKLIPRNKEESDEIRKIIAAIKYHMTPGLLTQSGVFFTYPEMVIIKLHPNDDYTYKFKPCVLKTFDVNYAPVGAPSFYWYNGAPTAVEIKMSLQEIEYFTKLDYLDQLFMDQMSGNVLSAALTGVAGAPANLFAESLTLLPQFNALRNLPFGLAPVSRALGSQ